MKNVYLKLQGKPYLTSVISCSFLFFLGFILFLSCNNDFDLYADDRNVTIIYGLLDPSDSINYVKIYKGFQSEGDASIDAANMNNYYYDVDKIDACLEEYLGDVLLRTIPLDTTTSVAREEGTFEYPKQLLYYTAETLDQDATYVLKVINKENNEEIKKVITSTTPIVNDFRIQYPYDNLQANLLSNSAEIRINVPSDAYAFEVIYKFKYIEVSKATGQIVKRGTITRNLTSSGFLYGNGNTNVTRIYIPNQLYTILNNTLEADPSVIRYRDGSACIEIEAWAGEENYITYLEVNKPTSSVVQDHLEFTNVYCDNDEDFITAYGVFSSRNHTLKKLRINQESEDSLVKGSKTRHLGFDYYINSPFYVAE